MPADTPANTPEFTVSEISGAVKRTIESRFERVRVRGEISAFKRHSSGHLYLNLKDEGAVLAAVCWRGSAGRLAVRPEDGMEVIALGRLTTYEGQSKYQLVIEQMELAGEGAILKMIEERRRRLAAEGLFAAERKQDIPFLPAVVGVVTSPTGAVIRDILHRLADRFPVHVLVWPVAVQGEVAAAQIAAAIRGFDALPAGGAIARPDVVIVARGGGSLEDLMAFNEEAVVRAAADCRIPLISAVGHETDTTLIDFAADRRAPTPTAAAEMAVPVRAELLATVDDLGRRAIAGLLRLIAERHTRLGGLARGLGDPDRLLEGARQRLDVAGERLGNAAAQGIAARQARLEAAFARLTHPRERLKAAGDRLAALARAAEVAAATRLARDQQRLSGTARVLESLSFRKVLERGYAVVRDGTGHLVAAAGAARAAGQIEIEFHDGRVAAATGAPRRTPRPAAPAQETLL